MSVNNCGRPTPLKNGTALKKVTRQAKFSVEETNRRQFALIQATEEQMEQHVIRTTTPRPGFSAFVKYCQGEGIQVAVASSGVDLYINPILRNQ